MDGVAGVELDFRLEGDLRNGHPFDLDNLCEPVLRVLINGKGFFSGRRPNLRFLCARKRIDSPVGCRVRILPRPPTNLGFGTILIDAVYTGVLPTSATDPQVSSWLQQQAVGGAFPVNRRFGVALRFGSRSVNVGDVSTGPTKPLIDSLFPILGGEAGEPEDWRIDRLLVIKMTPGMAEDQLLLTVVASVDAE